MGDLIAPGQTYYEKTVAYIAGIVADLPGVGRVWDYHPFSNDYDQVLDLYNFYPTLDEQGAIRAFTIDREGIPATDSGGTVHQRTHQYVARYYWAVDVERGSKKRFQIMVDNILDRFKSDIWLNNNALDTAPLTVPVIGEVEFLGTLCHRAEMRFNVIDHDG